MAPTNPAATLGPEEEEGADLRCCIGRRGIGDATGDISTQEDGDLSIGSFVILVDLKNASLHDPGWLSWVAMRIEERGEAPFSSCIIDVASRLPCCFERKQGAKAPPGEVQEPPLGREWCMVGRYVLFLTSVL